MSILLTKILTFIYKADFLTFVWWSVFFSIIEVKHCFTVDSLNNPHTIGFLSVLLEI